MYFVYTSYYFNIRKSYQRKQCKQIWFNAGLLTNKMLSIVEDRALILNDTRYSYKMPIDWLSLAFANWVRVFFLLWCTTLNDTCFRQYKSVAVASFLGQNGLLIAWLRDWIARPLVAQFSHWTTLQIAIIACNCKEAAICAIVNDILVKYLDENHS